MSGVLTSTQDCITLLVGVFCARLDGEGCSPRSAWRCVTWSESRRLLGKAGRLVHNQTTLPQVLNLREGKPYNMQDVYSCLCG